MDPVTDAVVKGLIGAGPVSLLLFYFYRQKESSCREEMAAKQNELDAANLRVAALQDKLVTMLQSQIEGEPQRRETLSAIGRSVQEQTALLKEKLP